MSLEPFTTEHFRAWTAHLSLDTGEPWALEPFQAAFARDVFKGFTETWLVIPEGNAKTTLVAGLVLYHALFREDARVVVAASSRDQAGWLYDAAEGFIQRSGLGPQNDRTDHRRREEEPDTFRCLGGYREIRVNRSVIKIFASDDRTGDGANFTLAVLEELHRHRDLSLYRTWRGKTDKRGGQMIAISTAGAPDGEFEQVRAAMKANAATSTQRGAYLRALGEGTCLHEYALPPGRDPDNMRDVKMANPLKAITMRQLRKKRDSPAYLSSHWRRFVCGIAAQDQEFISPEEWDGLKVDIGGLIEGEPVWVAVRTGQMGGCGIGCVARRGDGLAVTAEQLPYDLRKLQAALHRWSETYAVQRIFVDARQVGMAAELMEATGLQLADLPQTPVRLMEATSTFTQLVTTRDIAHDGNPILREQVVRATMKESITGAYLEPTADIQAFVAVVMAAHEAMKGGPAPMIGLPSEVG